MRFSILLLAATTLIATQAAPVTVEPEAAAAGTVSPSAGQGPCRKYGDDWYCVGTGSVEPKAEAGALSRRFARDPHGPCHKFGDEWYCLGTGSVEPKAEAEAGDLSPRFARDPHGPCHKFGDEWYCLGTGSVEPKAAAEINVAGGIRPPGPICYTVGGKKVCYEPF
ncbi:hypothetical protein BGX24_009475 [Mortierella sp. AD032]|nr:hypothetical protein BGX24_009475 [Mortierella sp. AD032]